MGPRGCHEMADMAASAVPSPARAICASYVERRLADRAARWVPPPTEQTAPVGSGRSYGVAEDRAERVSAARRLSPILPPCPRGTASASPMVASHRFVLATRRHAMNKLFAKRSPVEEA